jgi:hypothetical protein
MSCYSPLIAYWNRQASDDGKMQITFNPKQSYKDIEPIRLPCGNCIGCRLEYARGWALRCINEASLYQHNIFLTLTYNDDNLPRSKSLSKRDYTLFIKRLRKRYDKRAGKKLRIMGVGEYGTRNHRPHYHLIVFDYWPEDMVKLRSTQYKRYRGRFHRQNKTCDLYTSTEIHNCWQAKGFISFGYVTFASAGYVARYCLKKIKGDMAVDYYGHRTTPFKTQSIGIGRKWIENNWNEIYPKDFMVWEGRKLRPVRYYDQWLEKNKPEIWKEVKLKRAQNFKNRPTIEEEAKKISQMDSKEKIIEQQLRRSL